MDKFSDEKYIKMQEGLSNGKTVADMWGGYEAVVPSNAGPTQVKETRNAFYAGAFAMFTLMMEAGKNSGEDAEECEEYVKSLAKECLNYATDNFDLYSTTH